MRVLTILCAAAAVADVVARVTQVTCACRRRG